MLRPLGSLLPVALGLEDEQTAASGGERGGGPRLGGCPAQCEASTTWGLARFRPVHTGVIPAFAIRPGCAEVGGADGWVLKRVSL